MSAECDEIDEIAVPFSPEMIEYFSANGVAALEELKRWIRQNVSIVALEERALRLAGLPSPEVDEGFDAFCRELAEGVARTGMPERIRTGFVIAAADIVRERMAEFQSRGTGHA
jgi:hypothetical protein